VNAITAIGVGGSAGGTSFEINFTHDIALSSNLPAFYMLTSVSVIVNGNGYNLDGAGQWRGLFVENGKVAIDNLNIDNTVAHGGAGGSSGGGGGAGLGGGLFLGAGAIVSINNVNFSGDAAIGGNGGSSLGYGVGTVGGGGGGMGTSGSHRSARHVPDQVDQSLCVCVLQRRPRCTNAYGYRNLRSNGRRVPQRRWCGWHDWPAGTGPQQLRHGCGRQSAERPERRRHRQSPLGSLLLKWQRHRPVSRLLRSIRQRQCRFASRPGGLLQQQDCGAQNGGFGGGGGGGLSGTYNAYTNVSSGGNGGFGGGGGGAGLDRSGSGGASGGAGGFGGGGGRSSNGVAGGAGGFGAGHGGTGLSGGGGGGLGAGGAIYVEEGGSLTIGAVRFPATVSPVVGPAAPAPRPARGSARAFSSSATTPSTSRRLPANR